jgi:hypothetical protein
MTGTSIVMWSFTQTIRRATSRRPMLRLKARNSAVPADGREIDVAVGGDAGDHGDDDPGDRIVEDGGGQHELAEVAPHRADVDQHHGQDLD